MTSTNRQRARSRCWFLTWNNIDESKLAQLDNIFVDCEYVCQLERGENETKHLQGVIRYSNPREQVDQNIFQLCHWERCRNWKNAIRYCTKVDTRIDGPWTNIDGLKWRQTIRSPLENKKLYRWQKDIIRLLAFPPDERIIYWYWDEAGCSGKTSLAKHICLKYRKSWIYLNGCSRDILCCVQKKLESNDLSGAIFGLTRQDADGVSYKSLEILKDGIGFSGKYESDMFIANPMHILVFANFPPNIPMLSMDRWQIVKIGS